MVGNESASARGSRPAEAHRDGCAARWLVRACLAALLSNAPLPAAFASTAERVFAAVERSVVVVEGVAQGSGVVVASRLVATNCDVLGDAAQIVVRQGRISHAASRARGNAEKDVCLLDVPTLDAPAVTLGEAARLRVGAAVYAVGAPAGLELSLSAGLVSQLRAAEGGPVVQTTAPISPGSSGVGLFDERGRLVGLTTLKVGRGQDLNVAVPAEWVAAAVAEHATWQRCRAAPGPRCLINEALATARGIAEAKGRAWVLADIAAAQAQVGDRQASAQTFATALAAVRDIAYARERASALRAIAGAQARAGDIAAALATARDIDNPKDRASALRGIAAAQARAGGRQATAQTFATALATARGIADAWER